MTVLNRTILLNPKKLKNHKLTLDDLPPADTSRWVISRKAMVVAAVQQGLLTLDDALVRYGLSEEEFNSWLKAIEHDGVKGLRATRVQKHRT